jgi:cytochrome c553
MFFATQTVTPRSMPHSDQVAHGRDIYQKTCFRCHGDNGMGNEKIARIAGQQPQYLVLSLKRYRNGGGVRTDPLMVANTKLLTDTQIDVLAAYVSTLR